MANQSQHECIQMKGSLKTIFGILQWTATPNGVVSFKANNLFWNSVRYTLIANISTDGVCHIVSLVCKLATETLEAEWKEKLPLYWATYLENHPSVMLRIKGFQKQKVLTSNVKDLWNILSKMEAQLAAFRMTLESLDPK